MLIVKKCSPVNARSSRYVRSSMQLYLMIVFGVCFAFSNSCDMVMRGVSNFKLSDESCCMQYSLLVDCEREKTLRMNKTHARSTYKERSLIFVYIF